MSNITPIQRIVGEFSPKIVELTDDVLFGDIWERPELSPRDRSLITVSALIMGGNTEQLASHLQRATSTALLAKSSSRRSPTWPSTQDGLKLSQR